ncbi:MAG TPA: hypothetical protein VHL31_14550 [Geminicoccus sp.]|uniref:hypothetical protein n=1 Tax=Geminicoccus sp. TaxID=2024832 RepID=UPI002E3146B1|nr:hypothetical protein [Geminicoccus sp.]HEX2527501.1 hypothetical protein [Geminicoccus sp.]
MAGQAGFFGVEERLADRSKNDDDLERVAAVVDFDLFARQLREAGYLAMSGQPVVAGIVTSSKQRNTKVEKQALKEERMSEEWQAKPAKLRQKHQNASPAKVS